MKSFVCSLCHNGILGGGLYLDSQSLTYKTNKLTVDKKYRNLVLPMQEIKEISWKWVVFPIATVNMKNGELYKFIIFNKSRFAKWFQEYSRYIQSVKFKFVGVLTFFPPIAPFKNRLASQGSTPLAAARGLAALHPIPETSIHKPKPGSCRKDGSCPVL